MDRKTKLFALLIESLAWTAIMSSYYLNVQSSMKLKVEHLYRDGALSTIQDSEWDWWFVNAWVYQARHHERAQLCKPRWIFQPVAPVIHYVDKSQSNIAIVVYVKCKWWIFKILERINYSLVIGLMVIS